MTLVGINPGDPGTEDLLAAGSWLPAGDGAAVVMPLSQVEADGAEPEAVVGTELTLPGFDAPLVVSGVFDDGAWDAWKDVDGGSAAPVVNGAVGSDPVPGARTLLLPGEQVRERGGSLYAIVGIPGEPGPGSPEDLSIIAAELLRSHAYSVVVSQGGERFQLEPGTFAARDAAGPLGVIALIGALIVLNTMLGAVMERKDELRIYGSLGLAPSQVAGLLMAEALVFAVLGVGGGYLAAQLLSQGLSAAGLLPEVTLNVSSGETLAVMGMLMVVVVVSTLYPSRLASRLSAPGYERGWDLTLVEQRRYAGMLPFYVSRDHELGINIFLFQYLREHMTDVAQDFHIRWLQLTPLTEEPDQPGGRVRRTGYAVTFRMHLPPYDTGVIQRVELETRQAGDNVCQVAYAIEHVNGEMRAWKRANRQFVRRLRRQYLLWNTLDTAMRDGYQREGAELMEREGGQLVREQQDEIATAGPADPLSLRLDHLRRQHMPDKDEQFLRGEGTDAGVEGQQAGRAAGDTAKARRRAYYSRPRRSGVESCLPGRHLPQGRETVRDRAQPDQRTWYGGTVPPGAANPFLAGSRSGSENTEPEPYEWRWQYRRGAGEAYGGGDVLETDDGSRDAVDD